LAGPLIAATRKQFEQQLAAKDQAIQAREQEVEREKAAVAAARADIDDQVAGKLDVERTRIAAEESQKAQRTVASDLKAVQDQLSEANRVLAEREAKLAEAQAAQAELVRARRELDDQKRELALTVETRVTESLGQVREAAKREAEEGLILKLREREEVIGGMQKQIEELKRKAEQGSQQLQGEALELVLEDMLRSRFPHDEIAPVPKGVGGGDCLQRVAGVDGQPIGSILWECKRTKNWSDGWLAKLRANQREAHADIAVLVSDALPPGLTHFDLLDGVWVVGFACAMPVATTLRQSLLTLSVARRAGEGQQTKMAQVYRYLTGSRFKHHVEGVVEQFVAMKADLDSERRAMTRLWAKREAQITNVITATASMYGDLQGIVGRSLDEIEGLELPLLGAPEVEVE
jgi:hypothetical protein